LGNHHFYNPEKGMRRGNSATWPFRHLSTKHPKLLQNGVCRFCAQFFAKSIGKNRNRIALVVWEIFEKERR
jgi:hypothetical protein